VVVTSYDVILPWSLPSYSLLVKNAHTHKCHSVCALNLLLLLLLLLLPLPLPLPLPLLLLLLLLLLPIPLPGYYCI